MSTVLPRPEEKRATVEAMFDRIAPDYERVNRLISLGQDRRWRAQAVGGLGLTRGSRVLDLACGTGDLCRDLAGAGYEPIGMDLSAGMLAAAHTDAPLVRADALCLPVPSGSIDGITCGFALRNFVDLEAFLVECARVLRPGGRVALLDAAVPESAVVRLGHGVWFGKVVPWLGVRLSGDPAYRYLPASTAYLPPAAELVAMARRAGLTDATRRTLMLGAVQLLEGTRA